MKLKRLFTYIICLIVGVSVIDLVFRIIFTPCFDNLPVNTKASATYRFVSCNEPASLIILGASRASHHYISQRMEDSLSINVYNYGGDGRCTLYQYLCLLKAMKNGTLSTVILDMSPAQISNEWVNDRISDLYPYYWKNDTVKMMVNEVKKENMSMLMLSSLIQFNSQYLNLVAPIPNEKGYTPLAYTGKPLRGIDNPKIIDKTNDEHFYSDIAIKYFLRMSDFCKRNNIKFIVCLSPSLSMSKANEKYIEFLCKDNGIDCWNLTNYIVDPILFSDFNHLNDEGAKLFTDKVIEKLNISK